MMTELQSQSFLILNESDRMEAINLIKQLPLDGFWCVGLKKPDEERSPAQERLFWLWMRQLERELIGVGRGLTHLDWARRYKALFMRPLLISQDEEYAKFYRECDIRISKAANKEKAKEIVLDSIDLKWLSMSNMHTFLFMIDMHCLDYQKVDLFIPNDLKWLVDSTTRGNTHAQGLQKVG
jgi:hypothetical protein